MTLARDIDRIDSDRLILRRIEHADLAFFTDLHADPEVSRYHPFGRPRTPQESRAWLQSTLKTYEELALGQLAVLRKCDGVLIGRCGLSDLAVEARAVDAVPRGWFERSEVPEMTEIVFERELGYTFQRSSWGHGYASEAAQRVFVYARDTLALPRVVSLIHPENVRSERVAKRFGVRHEDVVRLMARSFNRFVWPMSNPAG